MAVGMAATCVPLAPRVLLLFADVAHVALTFVGLPQSGWRVSDQDATNNAATTIICF